jgi:hypothetical protein
VTFATADDVLARWPAGGPPPPEASVIDLWLGDAEAILFARYPALPPLADAYADVHRVVVLVTARMVIRALANPAAAYRGVLREQIQDTSVTYAPSAGGLLLDDIDLAVLDDVLGIERGLVSVPLRRPDLDRALDYLDFDRNPFDQFPWPSPPPDEGSPL